MKTKKHPYDGSANKSSRRRDKKVSKKKRKREYDDYDVDGQDDGGDVFSSSSNGGEHDEDDHRDNKKKSKRKDKKQEKKKSSTKKRRRKTSKSHKKKKKRKYYSSSESSSSSDEGGLDEGSSKVLLKSESKEIGKREIMQQGNVHSTSSNQEQKNEGVADALINRPQKDNQPVRKRQMIPMRKEEYEAQQKVVREVFDEQSGRYRLVRGTGEIIERIVSRDDHERINKIATKGDGMSFAKSVRGAASHFNSSRRR